MTSIPPTAGGPWDPDERLTFAPGNTVGDTMHPSVATGGSAFYVVWMDYRSGNPEIYFKRRLTPPDPGRLSPTAKLQRCGPPARDTFMLVKWRRRLRW